MTIDIKTRGLLFELDRLETNAFISRIKFEHKIMDVREKLEKLGGGKET